MSARPHVEDLAQVAGGAERIIEGQLCFGRVQGALFGRPAMATIDRYELTKRLGAGGSGAVYRGWDPDLRRAVAVKIVSVRSPSVRARVVREAQALARVIHPAVVDVYDVGDVAAPALAPWVSGSLRNRANAAYLVMELVDGPTLDQWAAERSTWEVVAALAAAARGLAAAHRQGVVHGDFKPSNMLMQQERPRVIDWGLSVIDRETVEAGRGTPGFMAPELAHGEPTPASDQYALCWTLQELVGDPPPRIRAVVQRGLQPDPTLRHPSLDALADSLVDRRRRRSGVVAVGAIAAVGWIATTSTKPPRVDPPSLTSGIWSDERRREVAVALEQDPEPLEPMLARLDAWVQRWDETRAGENDPARQACLDGQSDLFAASLELVVDSGPRMLAGRVIGSLPDPRLCTTAPAACLARPTPEASIALIRAGVEMEAGDLVAARARVEDVILRTEVEGSSLLHARSLYALSRVEGLQGNAAAASLAERAYEESIRCGDDETATRAATQMVWRVGADRQGPDTTEYWVRQARASLARSPDPAREVWLLRGIAAAASLGGDHERALRTIDKARALVERELDLETNLGASVLSDEAMIRMAREEYSLAGELHQRALELRRKLLPAGHPDVGTSLLGLAQVAQGEERHDEAIALLEQARDEYTRTLGGQHTYSVVVLINLGAAYLLADKPELALSPARAAIDEIRTRDLGPELLARARFLLGHVLTELGHDDDAHREFARAATELPPTAEPALADAIDAQIAALRKPSGPALADE